MFQSFKVSDEIFSHKEEVKKGYIILESNEETPKPITEDRTDIQEITDFNSLLSKANLDGGKKIAKQCVGCHSVDNNQAIKVGPPLWGIVGRQAASIDGYSYSDALAKFKKAWSKKELYYFLEKPKDYIKGTKMIYKGLKKPSDRVNLISYLESLK